MYSGPLRVGYSDHSTAENSVDLMVEYSVDSKVDLMAAVSDLLTVDPMDNSKAEQWAENSVATKAGLSVERLAAAKADLKVVESVGSSAAMLVDS